VFKGVTLALIKLPAFVTVTSIVSSLVLHVQ
jgi:hypothetical protein